MDIDEIKELAEKHDWKFLTFQENIGMASFTKPNGERKDNRINIYITKMTVATCMDHPKQGNTQMFRKNVTPKEMNQIFHDPRVHTDKGYKTK